MPATAASAAEAVELADAGMQVELSVEDELAAELAALKEQLPQKRGGGGGGSGVGQKKQSVRFAPTDTGCRGIRFIRNAELHHVATVGKIMDDVCVAPHLCC
jgi:hypothetical protein